MQINELDDQLCKHSHREGAPQRDKNDKRVQLVKKFDQLQQKVDAMTNEWKSEKSQRIDKNSRFTQIYPEDSEGDPESSSPANLVNAITTRSMANEVEKNKRAQVQPDSNQGQLKQRRKEVFENLKMGKDYNVKRVIPVHKLYQWFKGPFGGHPVCGFDVEKINQDKVTALFKMREVHNPKGNQFTRYISLMLTIGQTYVIDTTGLMEMEW
uniref:Uncharacterized protein n=1 Tax=Romanomermis culicivorax TaxID=13658 RepID=A0A915HUP9_ROMCU